MQRLRQAGPGIDSGMAMRRPTISAARTQGRYFDALEVLYNRCGARRPWIARYTSLKRWLTWSSSPMCEFFLLLPQVHDGLCCCQTAKIIPKERQKVACFQAHYNV